MRSNNHTVFGVRKKSHFVVGQPNILGYPVASLARMCPKPCSGRVLLTRSGETYSRDSGGLGAIL